MLKTLFLLLTSVVFYLLHPVISLLFGNDTVEKIALFLSNKADEQVKRMEKEVDQRYKEDKERIEKMRV
jgi:hypothetical protein